MGAGRAVWRSGVAAVALAAASVGPMASGAAATEVEHSSDCEYIEGTYGYRVPIPPPPERDLSGPMSVFDFAGPGPVPDEVLVNPQSRGNKYTCWGSLDDDDDWVAVNGDLVGMAVTRSALGYWTVDRDGRVREMGDARNLGGLSHLRLAAPVVDIESTSVGDGFWLAGAEGGVFAFGSARFFGSVTFALAGGITGMAARPQGDGYWLVGTDGGVFSFGGAPFFGSAAGLPLRAPVVEIEQAPDGEGYWLVAADGGVFAFGSARFHGASINELPDAIAIETTGDPYGYWILHEGFAD